MSWKLIEIQYSSLQVCFNILPPLLLATASLLRIEQAARGSGFWDLRYENSGRGGGGNILQDSLKLSCFLYLLVTFVYIWEIVSTMKG